MKRVWLWGLLGVAVVAGVATGLFFWSRNPYAERGALTAPAISQRTPEDRPAAHIETRRITETRRPKYEPAWSTDGQYLAYHEESDEVTPGQGRNPVNLMVIGADGSGLTKVSQDPVASGGVYWTRDNALLFDLGGLFVLANTAGEVTNHWYPPGPEAFSPALSPDGARLYYSAQLFDGGRRYGVLSEIDLAGGESAEVYRQPEYAAGDRRRGLAISSSGRLVAFPVVGESAGHMAVVEASTGQKVAELTDVNSTVAWAPRGERLAYTSPDGEVVIADFVRGKVLYMRHRLMAEGRVAFSPDGRRLAYAGRKTRDGADLYLLDLAQNRLTRLALGLDVSDPAWSPDGLRIAVVGRARQATQTAPSTDNVQSAQTVQSAQIAQTGKTGGSRDAGGTELYAIAAPVAE